MEMVNSCFKSLKIQFLNKIFSAPENITCLPSIGIFIFHYDERMNYTEASITCENHNGYLANVLSDIRTNYLSFLVAQQNNDLDKNSVIFQENSNQSNKKNQMIPIRHAFVGLREVRIKGQFLDSNGIPIQCYRFRAWEPKYPR